MRNKTFLKAPPMIIKLFTLVITMVFVVFESHSQQVSGTLTLHVVGHNQITVDDPDHPIHFDLNLTNQHVEKHIQITSNQSWKLLVQPQSGYLINERNDKIEVERIGYSIKNITGSGSINSPEETYKLYVAPINPPIGTGSVSFDVVFTLDTEGLTTIKWGTYNTKVEFICVPLE
jgi:hypothetical protein